MSIWWNVQLVDEYFLHIHETLHDTLFFEEKIFAYHIEYDPKFLRLCMKVVIILNK